MTQTKDDALKAAALYFDRLQGFSIRDPLPGESPLQYRGYVMTKVSKMATSAESVRRLIGKALS